MRCRRDRRRYESKSDAELCWYRDAANVPQAASVADDVTRYSRVASSRK